MSDIKMPPLPHWCEAGSNFGNHMQAYARAAVEANSGPDGWTEDQIAQAAMEAEIPDSKLESLLIALSSAPPIQHQEMQAQPAERKPCPLCGAVEPFSGTCGGGRDNPSALCFQPAQEQPRHLWDGSPMPNYSIIKEKK